MQVLRTLATVAVIAFFGFVIVHTGPRKIQDALTGLHWGWALLAPLFNLLYSVVESYRMSVILSSIKKGVKVKNAFVAVMLGFLGNTILPLRVGDGVRAYILAKREEVSFSSSLSTVMIDRIADFCAFFAMLALTAWFYPLPPKVKRMSFLAAGLLFAVLFILVLLMKCTPLLANRFKGKYSARISQEMSRFFDTFAAMRHSGLILPVAALSILIWVVRAVIIWVMLKAFGFSLPWIATPVVLILLNLGIACVNTPGNIGGFEIAAAAGLKLFGISSQHAISYAIALHLIEHAPIVMIGIGLVFFGDFKLRDMSRTGHLIHALSSSADGLECGANLKRDSRKGAEAL